LGKLNLLDLLRRNKELAEMAISYDIEEIANDAQELYLKRMALDTCANFIARAAGQSVFLTDDPRWDYKLNVRPNKNMSAAQFWEKVVYQMIVHNEALVVLSDSDDLLIADSWTRNEYALYEDSFLNVSVKDFTFTRTFSMGDVLYFQYGNQKLESFTRGLFADYSELYNRLLEAAKRNNQIRGTVSIEGNADPKKIGLLQEYIDKLFTAFNSKSIALAPLTKGFEYKEHSNTTGTSNLKVDDVVKVPNILTDWLADVLGIPTALLHGGRAELKDNIQAFNKYCLTFLLKKIVDELNAKTIDQRAYTEGQRVKVVGANRPDIFEIAESIDKLISSSTFNTNEIRAELGYEPREGGDVYVRTKNYEAVEKGGEEE